MKEHVLPQLPPPDQWISRAEIKQKLLEFVGNDPAPIFWAYYGDYDWVALCQLFGPMIDLPKHFPKLALDIKQLHLMLEEPKLPPDPTNAHDALADAKWNMEILEFMRSRQVNDFIGRLERTLKDRLLRKGH